MTTQDPTLHELEQAEMLKSRLTKENNRYLITEGAELIVIKAIEDIRRAVVSTLGPNGKVAIIKNGTAIKTTKDGVTVAKSIRFDNEHMELVARAMTEPAIKTDAECGDGTTTTIQLTAGLSVLLRKYPMFRQQKIIESIIKDIINKLTEMSISVDVNDPRLYQMALTSSNQDEELTRTIIDIYRHDPKRFPEIELKEHFQITDKVERIQGRPLKMKYANPTFGRGQAGGDLELSEYRAVVIDDRLARLDPFEVAEALGSIAYRKPVKPDPANADQNTDFYVAAPPLLLIARSIEQDVITPIIQFMNDRFTIERHKPLPIIALSTDAGGAIGTSEMQDLGVILNAPVITSLKDIGNIEIPINTNKIKLGSSRSILLELKQEDNDRINQQADELEKRISEYSMSDRYSLRARFDEKRLRHLRGDLVIVYVGGETNSEVKERVDRYEDVVKAIRSGLINGILPGCGTSLIVASKAVLATYPKADGNILWDIKEVCSSIFVQLMTGVLTPSKITAALVNTPVVLNIATGATGDDAGVYDTAYATITALKGGFQTAKILANVSSLITGDKLFSVASRVN